jgi:hypothetical protein
MIPGLEVTVQRADGKKCERCWNYSTHVGENPRYPTVCERCTDSLSEIEGAMAPRFKAPDTVMITMCDRPRLRQEISC